ncbi:MAG: hypothetical protein QM817_30945 [Archangium sp.]
MFASLVAATLLLAAPPTPSGKGKPVTLSLRGVTAEQVLTLLGTVAHLNVVVLDRSRRTAFDLEVKDKPWDLVFDDVVKRAGLATRRGGNLVLVDTEEKLAKRAPMKSKGKKLNLTTAGATFDEVAALLEDRELQVPNGSDGTLTVRWSNLPVDFIAQLATELTAKGDEARGRLMPMLPNVPPCKSMKAAQGSFTLRAVMSGDAKPAAVVRDDKGNFYLVHRGDCLGPEGSVSRIARDSIATSNEMVLSLGQGPMPAPPPEPMSEEDQKAYDEMLKELEAGEGNVAPQ